MLRAQDPLYVGSELGRTWSRLEGNERSHPYHPYRLEWSYSFIDGEVLHDEEEK